MWGISLLTNKLCATPKYLINSAMVAGFLLFAIRVEKINVGALVRSILRRK
jgi:hypothetical protein